MTLFHSKISRRALLQLLLALPVLSLFRKPPSEAGDADEIVEVNGWILRKRDLA